MGIGATEAEGGHSWLIFSLASMRFSIRSILICLEFRCVCVCVCVGSLVRVCCSSVVGVLYLCVRPTGHVVNPQQGTNGRAHMFRPSPIP